MKIENNIFKRAVVNYNKLIEFGFKKEKDHYTYSCLLKDDDFKLEVSIDKNGIVKYKVIDTQVNEEYTNIYTEMSGEFTNKIRNNCKEVLTDIKNKCFINKYFIYDQTNRIAAYILNKYSCEPEFLWDKTPGCGVFRNKNNKKWFGIIMNIDFSKLDNKNGEVEIINVKINRNRLDELLKINGFYKAYHMNKRDWISIILNGTLKDEDIIALIDESYYLIS